MRRGGQKHHSRRSEITGILLYMGRDNAAGSKLSAFQIDTVLGNGKLENLVEREEASVMEQQL